MVLKKQKTKKKFLNIFSNNEYFYTMEFLLGSIIYYKIKGTVVND